MIDSSLVLSCICCFRTKSLTSGLSRSKQLTHKWTQQEQTDYCQACFSRKIKEMKLFSSVKLAQKPHPAAHNATIRGSSKEITENMVDIQHSKKVWTRLEDCFLYICEYWIHLKHELVHRVIYVNAVKDVWHCRFHIAVIACTDGSLATRCMIFHHSSSKSTPRCRCIRSLGVSCNEINVNSAHSQKGKSRGNVCSWFKNWNWSCTNWVHILMAENKLNLTSFDMIWVWYTILHEI